jgi:hypothetical protein
VGVEGESEKPGQPLTQFSLNPLPPLWREGTVGKALLTLSFLLPSWNAGGGGGGGGARKHTSAHFLLTWLPWALPGGYHLFREAWGWTGVRKAENQFWLLLNPVYSSMK